MPILMAAGARRALFVVCACLLLLGCRGFVANVDESADETESGTSTSTTTPMTTVQSEPPPTGKPSVDGTGQPAPTPVPAAPPTTQPAAAADRDRTVLNAASAVTDGLEVEVVADHGPDYRSRPEFQIQVTLTNLSEETRYYSIGQYEFAALTDATNAVVWTSTECNPTLEVYEVSGGVAPIDPGDEVRVIVRYPQPDRSDDLGCHLPDGGYTLYGLFPVCPNEHIEETANPGTYSCPEGRVRQHQSAGLPVTFG